LKGYVTTMPKTGNEKYFISRGFNWSKMPFERLRDHHAKTRIWKQFQIQAV